MSDSEKTNTSPEAALAEGFALAQKTRREFMAASAVVAGSAAVSSLLDGCGGGAWERFFQQHYRRLTDEDKRRLIARLEEDARRRYGVEVDIRDPRPRPGVEFAYCLNLTACVGCRRCEYACAEENNTSRRPEMHYIKVLRMENGSINVDESESRYEGQVPEAGHFYMPVQCHQCRNAPCVRACPVGATWAEPDGVVVVDYDWCIGCRYCQAACPYFARRFNFSEPSLRPSEINPDQGLLSNRLRPAGVVEKCTFCLHRTRRGEYPACLEACPTGSRKFGNLLDPNSEVRHILDTKRVYILHEEAGTFPRFYYFFS
jgi:molybdopterin-containing oxidoreductase family iron-sulfur binding subunit